MPRRKKLDLDAIACKMRSLLNAAESFKTLQYSHFCRRLVNFFKVYVLLTFARQHHGGRFFGTLAWREVFYQYRVRLASFVAQRAAIEASECLCFRRVKVPREMKFMKQCSKRRAWDSKQLDQLEAGLATMRGPHALDLGVFMHLSRRANLGNDLALLVFDFM